MAKSLLF